MDKKCLIDVNGNRKIAGILRGYDPFMNLVIDDAYEVKADSSKVGIGMIVRLFNECNRFCAVIP